MVLSQKRAFTDRLLKCSEPCRAKSLAAFVAQSQPCLIYFELRKYISREDVQLLVSCASQVKTYSHLTLMCIIYSTPFNSDNAPPSCLTAHILPRQQPCWLSACPARGNLLNGWCVLPVVAQRVAPLPGTNPDEKCERDEEREKKEETDKPKLEKQLQCLCGLCAIEKLPIFR